MPRTPKPVAVVTPQKRKGGNEAARDTPSIRLRYEEDFAETMSAIPRRIDHLVPAKNTPPFQPGNDLVFMAYDIVEEGPRFCIWGVTREGQSVMLRVRDFQPYFYIAAPHRPVPTKPGEKDSGFESNMRDELLDWRSDTQELEYLRSVLNRSSTAETKIERIEPVHKLPIMYYRPDTPDGGTFLRCWLPPGGNARKAGSAALRVITGGGLRAHGLVWRDQEVYEHEVATLQRFLVDVPCSGGAWLHVPAAEEPNALHLKTPVKGGGTNTASSSSSNGYLLFTQQGERMSTADIEVGVTSWRSITCLTPDATQLGGGWRAFDGNPPSPAAAQGAEAARRGDVAPLRLMLLDVCLGTRDGKERAPVPSTGDPIVAISCIITTHTGGGGVEAAQPPSDISKDVLTKDSATKQCEADVEMGGFDARDGEEEDDVAVVVPSVADVAGGPRATAKRVTRLVDGSPRRVSFVLAGAHAKSSTVKNKLRDQQPGGADVVICTNEAELLLTWHAFFTAVDPDVLVIFQMADTLEAIRERWASLRLTGGALKLSRHVQGLARPVAIKKVTMYSAAWVRSQSRMSSTSNQETFKAENTGGRAVLDLLRTILTSSNLASFSMVDCVQSLLGETLEVLGAHSLAVLAGIALPDGNGNIRTDRIGGLTMQNGCASDQASPLRLARYSLRRVSAVQALLARLAMIEECVEMARATGLTIPQVLYNAQMVRTWSLLLRVSGRDGVLIPQRPETSPLTEHTFILHPVEAGTTGLYRQPVAILDFASLYPSIYRAYNLCYTTLLHPDDAECISTQDVVTTPTGAKFVSPNIRRGILPGILAALISARAATRDQLRQTADPAQRAVLDCRQKALKVTANALYGFTGAQASPLQCVPLADSCLAYGAASCRQAKQVLEEAAARQELGQAGLGARVIYGHTDSLFLLLPSAKSATTAIQTGRKAAEVVSKAFPDPMELKFERVCAPLLLLHVNRYAGRAYEREDDVDSGGELIVKGLKSMWRQTAPILRTTLHGALVRILLRDDVAAAVEFVQSEIRRLLTGKVSLHELVMTGGLWRVTGEQVGRAAVEEDATTGGTSGSAPSSATIPAVSASTSGQPSGEGGEEIRGPHVALAVRLSRRDPGRKFVLGERLQYVLTAGHRLQDEAAEDPLAAARGGLAADLDLYWRNKMQRPLAEVFAPCLSAAQLQELLNGPHTRVKVDIIASRNAAGPSGPASPPPGKGRGRQLGMTSFFRITAKCLSCRTAMKHTDVDSAPGLCDNCKREEGKWSEAYLAATHEAAVTEARLCSAYAACRACHSGLLGEQVLCDNTECPVTYARLECHAMMTTAESVFRRLDIF